MTGETMPGALARLRAGHPARPTQTAVAALLGVERQALSAWERGAKPVPAERLRALALLYAVPGPPGADLSLAEPDGLTDEQRQAYEDLLQKLESLPAEAADLATDTVAPEPSVGRFWRFDDDLPITIVGSKQPEYVWQRIPEADRRHPDYTETLHHADADAEIELYGQIRAMNPDADVRRIVSDQVKNRHVAGHVVIVGGGGVNPWARWFADQMAVPVGLASADEGVRGPDEWAERRFRLPLSAVGDDGEAFEVEGEGDDACVVFRPEFRRLVEVRSADGGTVQAPNLYKDVALIARRDNPFRTGGTVTLFVGLFSRGTYGAVRAFTDPNYVRANEAYLAERVGARPAGQRFWSLHRVLCDRSVSLIGTVDLNNDEHRLLEAFG